MSADRYKPLHDTFRWKVPAFFNIAQACSARWARSRPHALALRCVREDGSCTDHTYGQLQQQANRLANGLRKLGVQRGDRVAVVMPQRVETAVAHLALYQMGAVAMPLSILFGPDALEYRLQDSEAVVAIVDESAIKPVQSVRAQCPSLRCVVAVGAAQGQADIDLATLSSRESARFSPVKTAADDPAVLIYTSGTTGPPKGALIPHRALIGNLTGFVCSQNWFEGDDAVFWSPADWAWTGGLMDALLPTLYFGRTIVGYQGRFDPLRAFALMQDTAFFFRRHSRT
jgi:acetyl-CoA synthetase